MPIEVPQPLNKWFAAQKVAIQLFPDEMIQYFGSVEELYDFLEREAAFWQPIDNRRSKPFSQFAMQLSNALQGTDSEEIQREINNVISGLRNSSSDGDLPSALLSETSLTLALKHAHESYGKQGYDSLAAALNGHDLALQRNRPMVLRNELFGYIDAYMYQYLNDDVVKSFRDERTALVQAHSEFNNLQTASNEAHAERRKMFDAFMAEYTTWTTSCTDEYESQKGAFTSEHTDQLVEHRTMFDADEKRWKNRITELEELYQSKLMLEAPVDYWDKLEKKHRKSGFWFAVATFASVLTMIIILTVGLYFWPPKWMDETKLTLSTLKGSFLLLTITSLAVYIVHFLAKFSVSSYHLARDAEERKQLTYVYLSLLQKNAVSAEQQGIILAALFSRADTGLLKGEHSPTMPVSQISSLIGKG